MLGLGNGNGDGLTPSGATALKKVVWYKSDFSSDIGGWTSPDHGPHSLTLDVVPNTATSALKFETGGSGSQYINLDEDDYQNPWPQGDVRMGYTIKVYASNDLQSLYGQTEGGRGREIEVPASTLFEVSSALEDNATSATALDVVFEPDSSNVGDIYFTDIEFYYYI